jgi:shikimate kinase
LDLLSHLLKLMNIIESTIKAIVEAQGYLYFRSVNINDLNEQVGNTNIAQGIGVYSNLPAISNTVSSQSNNILMQYDIEVYYLKLSAGTDDTGDDTQAILDDLYDDAQQFYDQMKDSGLIAGGSNIESYDLDATETLKMTKEVLTGWRIQITIPIWRTDFYCFPTEVEGTFQNIITLTAYSI